MHAYNVIIQLVTIPDQIYKSISPNTNSHTNITSVSSKSDIQAEMATIMQAKHNGEPTTKSNNNINEVAIGQRLDTTSEFKGEKNEC